MSSFCVEIAVVTAQRLLLYRLCQGQVSKEEDIAYRTDKLMRN